MGIQPSILSSISSAFVGEPSSTPTKEIPLVMVHGIFDTGADFGSLKLKLRHEGYKCLAPDLKPANGRTGLDKLTTFLEHYIKDHLGEGTPYHLLGYSMGGILSRNYLRTSPNRENCVSLTTLASPHHGTKIAHLYPRRSGVELRPNSTFLNTLNHSPLSVHPTTLSVRTKYDGVIIPSSSSVLQGASNLCVYTPSHPSLLMHPKVKRAILEHLKKAESRSPQQAQPAC